MGPKFIEAGVNYVKNHPGLLLVVTLAIGGIGSLTLPQPATDVLAQPTHPPITSRPGHTATPTVVFEDQVYAPLVYSDNYPTPTPRRRPTTTDLP